MSEGRFLSATTENSGLRDGCSVTELQAERVLACYVTAWKDLSQCQNCDYDYQDAVIQMTCA